MATETLKLFSNQLTQNVSITSVPKSVSVALDSISSVLQAAASNQNVDISKLATITDSSISQSIEERILLAQATINYYSILNNIATATSVSDSLFTQAAQASAAMETMYSELAFYNGNILSLGGNLVLAIIFGILLVCQVVFGVYYKQLYILIFWSVGLTLEVLGYSGRVWLHYDMFSLNAYLLQTICIAIGPGFLLAGLYYLFAQTTLLYGDHHSILAPVMYLYAFMLCDLVSGSLLGAGAGVAANSSGNFQLGIDLMTAGFAIQVGAILFLQCLWYYFIWNIYRSYKRVGDNGFNPDFAAIRGRGEFHQVKFVIGISIATLLLFVRSIYKLIEVIEGSSSEIAVNEIYFMTLESLMIVLASVIMTICHPGFTFGRNANLHIDRKNIGIIALIERRRKITYNGDELSKY